MSRRLFQNPWIALVSGLALIAAGVFLGVYKYPWKPITPFVFGALLCADGMKRLITGRSLFLKPESPNSAPKIDDPPPPPEKPTDF
jgi:uncharacterized membrane protein HdeD (DUF308 family)